MQKLQNFPVVWEYQYAPRENALQAISELKTNLHGKALLPLHVPFHANQAYFQIKRFKRTRILVTLQGFVLPHASKRQHSIKIKT